MANESFLNFYWKFQQNSYNRAYNKSSPDKLKTVFINYKGEKVKKMIFFK